MQTVLGHSRMIPVNEGGTPDDINLPMSAQALPPIGLSLRKSLSLLNLVNHHLACSQA